jgi:mutator protein MutT
MSRSYPKAPSLGVGAVVLQNEGVLLARRGTSPNEGAWIFPGGLVELGERIEDALVREVKEETGWMVRVVQLVELLDYIDKDHDERVRYHYIIADYLCEYVEGDLQAGSDVTDVRIVPFEQLAEYGVSEKALEVIAEAKRIGRRPVRRSR